MLDVLTLALAKQAAGNTASPGELNGLHKSPLNWPEWTEEERSKAQAQLGILPIEGVGF